MPALRESGGGVEGRACRLEKTRGYAVARVHHRLAEPSAQPAPHELLGDDVAELRRAHVEDGRRAGEEQVEDPQPHARAERCFVQRGLERPDPRAQPLQEWHVLGETAKQRLHEVHVRLDDARHDHATRDVDDLGVGRRRLDLPDRGDARAGDKEIAPHRTWMVFEREERAAAQQRAHCW